MDRAVIINGDKVQFSYVADADYRQHILRELDFIFYEKQHIAVVGANGSGKSTFARQLNALLVPDQGLITIHTENGQQFVTSDTDSINIVRRNVGMVFQNPENQIVAATVEDDIIFGMENIGLDRATMRERLDYCMEKLKLQTVRFREPWQLSGGQKQRVAIAGVLAMQPQVIVLDEATSMLDPQGRQEVLTAIEELKREGKTIIHITHDMQEAISADLIYIMHTGKWVWQGSAQQLAETNELPLHDYGLELPFALRFSKLLQANGCTNIKGTLELHELVEQLCQ